MTYCFCLVIALPCFIICPHWVYYYLVWKKETSGFHNDKIRHWIYQLLNLPYIYKIYKTSNFIRNQEKSIELIWNINPPILYISASGFVLLFCFMLIKYYFLSSCKNFILSIEESFSIVVVIELVDNIWLVLSKLFMEWSLLIGLPESDCTFFFFSLNFIYFPILTHSLVIYLLMLVPFPNITYQTIVHT